jgi:hypothetical protein
VAVEPARHGLAHEQLLLDRLLDQRGLVRGGRLEARVARVVGAEPLDVVRRQHHRRRRGCGVGERPPMRRAEEREAAGDEVEQRCAKPTHPAQLFVTSVFPLKRQSGVVVISVTPVRSVTWTK